MQLVGHTAKQNSVLKRGNHSDLRDSGYPALAQLVRIECMGALVYNDGDQLMFCTVSERSRRSETATVQVTQNHETLLCELT